MWHTFKFQWGGDSQVDSEGKSRASESQRRESDWVYTCSPDIPKYLWKVTQDTQDSDCQRKGQENAGHAPAFMESPPAGCDCSEKPQVSHCIRPPRDGMLQLRLLGTLTRGFQRFSECSSRRLAHSLKLEQGFLLKVLCGPQTSPSF